MSDAIVHSRYSPGEELANALTHALGLMLSAVGLIVLIVAARLMSAGAIAIISCAVYGASLIALYAASTLYHSARLPASKNMLRTLDHLAIFLLIAGTYT
ncbi:MAG: hemolysin III family protein, partial [Rudaea sp.]